jgi:hypothetical protein
MVLPRHVARKGVYERDDGRVERLRGQRDERGGAARHARIHDRGQAIAAVCHSARPGQNGRNVRGATLRCAAHVLRAAAREVHVFSVFQWFVRSDEVQGWNAPRAKLLICFHSSIVRPDRTLRLLSCLKAVERLHVPAVRKLAVGHLQ